VRRRFWRLPHPDRLSRLARENHRSVCGGSGALQPRQKEFFHLRRLRPTNQRETYSGPESAFTDHSLFLSFDFLVRCSSAMTFPAEPTRRIRSIAQPEVVRSGMSFAVAEWLTSSPRFVPTEWAAASCIEGHRRRSASPPDGLYPGPSASA